jgi:hypothetical protein
MKLKTSLVVGVLLSIFLSDYFKLQDYCSFECSRRLDDVLLWWFVLNFLPKKFYDKWWSYTKFAVPIALIVSASISYGILHSSPGTWQDILDIPLQIFIVSILILGSIIQIVRGYYQK